MRPVIGITVAIDASGPPRAAFPPIQVTTPQGPGYRIEDGKVKTIALFVLT